MDVPLELSTVYRLISAPGFVSQDTILPTGPQIITELHQALVDQAFFPCPDPPPETAAVDEDEDKNDNDALEAAAETDDNGDQELAAYGAVPPAGEAAVTNICEASFLKTRNPELETRQAQLEALRLLQQHFPDLDLSHADLPFLSDINPKPKRDTSGTLPGQTDPHAKYIIENQQDDSYEKNYAKHPNVGRDPQGGVSQSTRRAAKAQAPPAILESDAPPAAAEALHPDSLETQNSKLETTFSYDPWLLIPDHCPEDSLETQNSKLETTFPETAFEAPPAAAEALHPDSLATQNSKLETIIAPAEPDLALLLSNSADDLFEITHGYKRNNPPKHIPNRRWEEDCRSSSIFGDPSKIYG